VLSQQQQPPPLTDAAGAAAVGSRRRRMSARDRRITRALTRENPNWRQEQQEQQRRLQFLPATDPPAFHLSPDTPEDQPSGPDSVPLPTPRHQLPAPGPSAPHLLQAALPTGATLHFLQPHPLQHRRSQRGSLSLRDVPRSHGGSNSLQPLQLNNKQPGVSNCSIAVKVLRGAGSYSQPCIWWVNGPLSGWILRCGVMRRLMRLPVCTRYLSPVCL
jgi:hypothetical protein